LPIESKITFEKSGNKLIAQSNSETIWIEPFGENCLRFRSTINKEIIEENWTLLLQPEIQAKIEIRQQKATIKNSKIMAEISADGTISYFTNNRRMLLEEL